MYCFNVAIACCKPMQCNVTTRHDNWNSHTQYTQGNTDTQHSIQLQQYCKFNVLNSAWYSCLHYYCLNCHTGRLRWARVAGRCDDLDLTWCWCLQHLHLHPPVTSERVEPPTPGRAAGCMVRRVVVEWSRSQAHTVCRCPPGVLCYATCFVHYINTSI